MKKLIKMQVRNVFHNKLFYVCLAIALLLSLGVNSLATLLSKDAAATPALEKVVEQFTSEIDIIGMIFITVFCTFDFTEGTTKNIIARGYTKAQLLFSKYIASFIGVLAMILIISAISFLLYIKNGLGYDSTMPMIILVSLFKIIAYTLFYATISFILEKTSSSIIANLFLTNIIMLILGIADSNLKLDIAKYWIDNVGDKFATKATLANMPYPIIMYSIYSLIFIGIGIYFAKNKEIK